MNTTPKERVKAHYPEAHGEARPKNSPGHRWEILSDYGDKPRVLARAGSVSKAWAAAAEFLHVEQQAALNEQARRKASPHPAEALLQHMRVMAHYWANVGGLTKQEALDGLAFSICSAIDGVAAIDPIDLVGVRGEVLNPDTAPMLHDAYYNDEIRNRK